MLPPAHAPKPRYPLEGEGWPLRHVPGGGRYWARTSDLRLVEEALVGHGQDECRPIELLHLRPQREFAERTAPGSELHDEFDALSPRLRLAGVDEVRMLMIPT
jgi:hypothetical protein